MTCPILSLCKVGHRFLVRDDPVRTARPHPAPMNHEKLPKRPPTQEIITHATAMAAAGNNCRHRTPIHTVALYQVATRLRRRVQLLHLELATLHQVENPRSAPHTTGQ